MTALEQDIQETREHLGDTVDALAAKAQAGKKRAGIVALIGLAAVAGFVLWRRFG
jgi:hypothetical protein